MNTKLLLITSLCLVLIHASPVNSQDGPAPQNLNLVVSNVCDYYSQYVVSNHYGIIPDPPELGHAHCITNSSYAHIDTLHPFSRARYLSVTNDSPSPEWDKRFYVAGDQTILCYKSRFPSLQCSPVVVACDTLSIDSIAGIQSEPNRLYVIRNASLTDNLAVYDTLSAVPVFSTLLPMTPRFLETYFNSLAVLGTDANNNTRLMIFETGGFTLLKDTVLGSFADNPIMLAINGSYHYYIASQPGDSVLNLTLFQTFTNTLTNATVYSYSGAHAFACDNSYFYFQPETDSLGNSFDTYIYKIDLVNLSPYATFNSGIRFNKFIYAGGNGFGFYPYLHGVMETALNNRVLIYNSFNFSLADSFQASYQVDLIESDFRCPLSVDEYDDALVALTLFPNPAGNQITMNASGLICGREYKMDLVDQRGRVVLEKQIHAKMNLEIPLAHLSPGVYHIRIHTLKGIVTGKFVKQ